MKNSVSYAWLSECVSIDNKPTAVTIISLANATPVLINCLVFIYVSRDWFMVNLIAVIVSYFALFISFFCPESPKWLLCKGKRKEAIQCLNKIAKFNGRIERIPDTARFVEDPVNIAEALCES